MISDKMAEKLNQQINMEFYSSYAYLAMAAFCEGMNLTGFANWFSQQAKEEWEHGMKIYHYLFEQDREVLLKGIDQPESKFDSILAVFEETLKHEQKVTASINSLVAFAKGENDYATENFLRWFVDEQVEEEASAKAVIDKLKLIKDSIPGLLYLDRELGARQ